MTYTITDRTLALAAIFQATRLVHDIANTGSANEQDMETCINSIFCVNVDTAEDAFSGGGNTGSHRLRLGLRTLAEQLGTNMLTNGTAEPKNLYISKYVAGIMVLERRLKKDPSLLNTISNGIERARNQMEHFSLLHDNVIAGLANTYSNTISTLKPRIMVQGEHVYISNPNNANRIRALLLAAIRAAVLWRQCGGTRWQLLFQRASIVDEARRLLEKTH